MLKKYTTIALAISILGLSVTLISSSKVSATAPNGCYQQPTSGPNAGSSYEQLANSACANGETYPPTGKADPTKNCYVESQDAKGNPVWTPTSCDNIQTSGVANSGSVTNGNATPNTSSTGDSGIPKDCGQDKQPSCEVSGNKIITQIINPAIKVFSVLIGVVAVIMLIVAGIVYSSSQDDPKKVALAKKIIIDVVIGIAVYVFLFAILNYLLPQGVTGG